MKQFLEMKISIFLLKTNQTITKLLKTSQKLLS